MVNLVLPFPARNNRRLSGSYRGINNPVEGSKLSRWRTDAVEPTRTSSTRSSWTRLEGKPEERIWCSETKRTRPWKAKVGTIRTFRYYAGILGTIPVLQLGAIPLCPVLGGVQTAELDPVRLSGRKPALP